LTVQLIEVMEFMR